VPLDNRVADKTESQSMRSSRVLKPTPQVSQTISVPSIAQTNLASSIGSVFGVTAESLVTFKS